MYCWRGRIWRRKFQGLGPLLALIGCNASLGILWCSGVLRHDFVTGWHHHLWKFLVGHTKLDLMDLSVCTAEV